MDLGLAGKTAAIAAGTKGIGLACAQALAAEGCRVAICGRSSERFEEALASIPGEGRAGVCDVSQADSIEAWLDAVRADWGAPDILITNTGGPPAGSWPQMTDADWQSGFDSTLMAAVRMTQWAAPHMRAKGWGRIVHITSVTAREPSAMLPISTALRAGISALCRLQSDELAPDGVTVNCLLPGHTATDRQTHLAEKRAAAEGITVEQALERQGLANPVRRLGEPEEIGAAAAFLCSRQAAFITGTSLLVDGGLARSPF